jgi:hypothetical protein
LCIYYDDLGVLSLLCFNLTTQRFFPPRDDHEQNLSNRD